MIFRNHGVRGCALALFLATPLAAQDVPSGQTLTLHDVLVEQVGTDAWVRFRFLAPQIARDGGDVTFGDAQGDFEHLCDSFARPYVAEYALEADVIAISFMDRAVVFGQPDPQATQFFEVFRVAGDACIWEAL